MIEIEFRGKRINSNEWVYGGIAFGGEEYDNAVYITKPEVKDEYVQWFIEVDLATVGQYIGIRDCKRTEEYPEGEKIYKGDIVEIYDNEDEEDYYIAEVKYHAVDNYPAYDLCPFPGTDCNAISHYLAVGQIEVIGNIYDNPRVTAIVTMRGGIYKGLFDNKDSELLGNTE